MDSQAKVVLIEDNSGDVKLIKFALKNVKNAPELIHFDYGKDFLAWAEENGLDEISLILLDFNLPMLNGQDIMQMINSRFPDSKPPIVILSSSCSPIDIKKSYALGANAFVAKPVELDDFCETIEVTIKFWCDHNLLQAE
ncbi:MAG: response regulator [Saprospiraceae bacterium]|nr:response regulator [Saprospiraceae bacterium]MCB9326935.1 response regulator [Lewinellaceae bacterium]